MYLKNKNKIVSFRLSENEYNLLINSVKRCNMSLTDYIRNCIISKGVNENDRQTYFNR